LKTKNLLLIFTRNPVLGKCKTRLAATIGDVEALEIYKFLLARTVDITKSLDAKKEVYYSEYIHPNDIWNTSIYDKRLQVGEDLGKRMKQAFANGFEQGYENIVIIGSDMYDLDQSDIERAFETLNTVDFVIGPAQDGGYYLLGMNKLQPLLFENKDWGTSTVLADTLKNLSNENIKLLEQRNDIDTYEDIKDVPVFEQFIKPINNDQIH